MRSYEWNSYSLFIVVEKKSWKNENEELTKMTIPDF